MSNEEKSFPKTSINWYPGHMAKATREIKEILKVIDLVIEVADSRMPKFSRINLDNIINNKSKIVIYTKFDLADQKKTIEYLDSLGEDYIVTSDNDYKLKDKLIAKAKPILDKKIARNKARGITNTSLKALIIGIPNVGKSTIINRLATKKKAPAYDKAGVTKRLNLIKVDDSFYIVDTPGLLEKSFKSDYEANLLMSFNSTTNSIINPSSLAKFIYDIMIENYPDEFSNYYKIELDNYNQDLVKIAKSRGLVKNNTIDYNRTYELIINDFRKQKFGNITII